LQTCCNHVKRDCGQSSPSAYFSTFSSSNENVV